MASSSHSTIHRGGGGGGGDDDVDVGAGADEPQPQLQPEPQPQPEPEPQPQPQPPKSKPRLKPTTSTKVPTHLFKSLSTREPSFSDLTFSPARFSTSSSPCSPTPLHHKPLSFNNHTSHRCISSTLNKDRQILSIALSGPLVYTGSQASTIRIWKLPDFSELAQLKANKAAGAVRSLAVSDDRLFAGYADCKIRVWRRSWDGLGAHVRLATIPNIADYLRNYITGKDHKNTHLGAISSLAINTADDLLYSASVDTTVKVWRISKLKCIETIRAHTEPINAIVVGEDGVFYTASDDATVRVWRRHSYGGGGDRPHSLAVTLSTDSSPLKALALTADGMVLYGGCTDGYVRCWLKGWLSGHMHYGGPLQGHRHAVLCLACMSNYLVSGSADLTCRVWVRDGEGLHTCLAVLEGHMGPVRCVAAFAADGQDGCMVCTASLDGTLKIWRVTSSGNVSLGPTQGGRSTFQF